MASLNKVFLMGNLTRDPEIRYLQNGTALTKFGLAVNRSYKTRDGQQRDETCFVDITAWGRQAEVISEYCSKGRPLFVEGRLQFEQWQDQSGQRRSKLTVVLESFQFLGGRRDGGQDHESQQGSPAHGQRPDPQQPPQDQRQYQQAPPDPAPAEPPPPDDQPPMDDFDIQDDKIPF